MKKKILLIYNLYQSFVRKDFEILSENNEVKLYQFTLEKKPLSFFAQQLKAIFFLLLKGKNYDVFYIWFCDYHAFTSVFLSILLKKKSIIIVGGFDSVSIPQIKYGIFYTHNLRAKLAKWAYRNCTQIITVDESLIQSTNRYAGTDSITGVLNFVPEAKNKITAISTGYDTQFWQCTSQKVKTVLTIALVKNRKVFLRKGVDFILELAAALPQYNFVLVGIEDENLIQQKYRNLKNLQLFPILEQRELLKFYSSSKVYAQFSVSEGLPNVLCEAMLCECIPIGSSANGIPNAIGETGYILNERSIVLAKQYIIDAMESDSNKGKMARDRIAKLFPQNKRRVELQKIIDQICD